MAKNSITDYDNLSSNNSDVQSVDISEGCSPSGINNAIREVMAELADVNDGTVALTSPAIGTSLDMNGNDLILDADGDSKIEASTDDTINIISGGNTGVTVGSSGSVSFPNTSGLILQVQQDSTNTSESTTQTSNSSQTTSALSVNITPTSTSSKILVLVHLQTYNGINGASTYYNLYRDGTDLTLTGSGNSAIRHFIAGGTGVSSASFTYLDSPATTSQITYDIRYFVTNGTGYLSVSEGQSSITVMEIAG